MIEASIENYILLETVLGGIIVLLLLMMANALWEIRDLLREHQTTLTVKHVPPNLTNGDSVTISHATEIPIKGSTSDFLRRKK